jgi:hypothetical protein
MPADGRAGESPQQGIQSIEVGAQVLRALEAGRRPMALAAPDDLRHGGVRRARIRPRPVPRARDRPRHARPPDGRGRWGEADRLADALRSTAGQISAELGYRPA